MKLWKMIKMKINVDNNISVVSTFNLYMDAIESLDDISKNKNKYKIKLPLQMLWYIYKLIPYKNPSKIDYETAMKETATENNANIGKLMLITRLAITGVTSGPNLFDICDALGRNEVIERILRLCNLLMMDYLTGNEINDENKENKKLKLQLIDCVDACNVRLIFSR